MPQFGWHINIAKCAGCRGCEGACKQEFNLPDGVQRRRLITQTGHTGGAGSEVPFIRYISTSCNHCEIPACQSACPAGAIHKEAATGLVLQDRSKCLGCQRCIGACPYGAPVFNSSDGKADKCSGCAHRLNNTALPAEKRKPACVITCSSYALHFSADLAKIDGGSFGEAKKTTEAPVGYPDVSDPTVTKPSVRYSLKATD